MKEKQTVKSKKTSKTSINKGVSPPFIPKMEQWLQTHRITIVVSILLLSALIRMVYYFQLNHTDVIFHHRWSETDMSFFDQCAQRIAGGDILSDTAMHPIHSWTKAIATEYLRRHPDTLARYMKLSGQDSIRNSPEKMLWDRWYGGKKFHQEPLYPYFVALVYSLFGTDVRLIFIFQMMAGIMTNLLVYLVARRYFGDLVAAVAAFITVFFGPLLFNDLVLLRTTFTSFMAILLPYLCSVAWEKRKPAWWLLFGFMGGLAFLLNTFFLIFILGIMILVIVTHRKEIRRLMVAISMIIIGCGIAVGPLIFRNAHMGVPILSSSSNAAISFITENNNLFKSFTGWNFDYKQSIEIIEQSEGSFLKSVGPTLRTHENLWSYLLQAGGKLHAVFSWYEVANNTNFYFYREIAPVLFIAFFTFLLLTPLALAGLVLAIAKKVNAWPLFIMIITLIIPFIAFMVLARYRVSLVPVLAPFAGFSVIELIRGKWKGWQKPLILAGIIVLFLWANSPRNEHTLKVLRDDYGTVYIVHYETPMQTAVIEHNWNKAAGLLEQFFERYEPGWIRHLRLPFKLQDWNEQQTIAYFAWLHEIRFQVLSNGGNKEEALREATIVQKLRNAAMK